MIILKSKSEIEKIKETGLISANLLKYIRSFIQPGIKTMELDKIIEDYIHKNNAKSSLRGYQDFPAACCISVNDEVIHGIPNKRKLKEGDIVGIDVGIDKNGFISDHAYTFPVGNVSNEIKLLLERTELAMYKAISKVKDNVIINEISGTVENYINQFGYGIVKDYCGHGVGFKNHESPEIPNYRTPRNNRKLKIGTVFTIEPMINLGSEYVVVLDDGWTIATADNNFSAHFEHTIAITEDGFEILTAHPDDKESIKKMMA